MRYKTIFILLFVFNNIAYSQSQVQAGADLAASFPDLSLESRVIDLPEDGQWWDKYDGGWGFSLETQSRYDSPSGYFTFVTFYTYESDGTPVWYAGGSNYEPSEPYQWRDHKNFSNMPWGHNNEPVLADFTIPVFKFQNGTYLGSPTDGSAENIEQLNVRFKFTSPTTAVIYPDGGDPHEVSRFAWRDDSINPTLDWITDYSWHLTSSVGVFGNLNNGIQSKTIYDLNASMNFTSLDVSNQPDLKAFVGHQSHYKYYISNIKFSYKQVALFDQDTPIADKFMPYINGGSSNRDYAVIVHDPIKEHMSLYTVAGEPEPDSLRPDAGLPIKFRAKIDPDADVIDFYPLRCEGDRQGCPQTYLENDVWQNAIFSEQNIHRSTLKMFKIRTSNEAFMYQPNTGESDERATDRITQKMLEDVL